jgi:hypothetical protein
MRSIPGLRRLPPEWRLRIKQATPGFLLRRVRPNAIRELTRPTREAHGDAIPLYGTLCTWNEEDIVYASVTNAYRQGVARLHLIDNGSTDATVTEAVAAGAVHTLTFETAYFEEDLKYRLMNSQIERISRASPFDEIWWLLMDADEFVRPIGAPTVKDQLAEIDSACRVVGARVFDHYPDPGYRHPERRNPVGAQRLCREKLDDRCTLHHHKHPLLLWMRHRPRIEVEPGFHQLSCQDEPLLEPTQSVIINHFPFRDHDRMRARLSALERRARPEPTALDIASTAHMRARLATLDAVYDQRHDEVLDYRTGTPGLKLEPWPDIARREGLDTPS